MSACSITRTSARRRRTARWCSAICRPAPTPSRPGTNRWARRHNRSRSDRKTARMSASPSHVEIAGAADRAHSKSGDFVTLTKPRLNFLVLLTTAAAYSLGAGPQARLIDLVHTLVGTFLVAGGAAALNQVWERRTDRLMRRTQRRPLADKRMSVMSGTVFGLVLTVIGV